MPISNRGTATYVANSSGTSITATKPTGSASGDFAIAQFAIGNSGAGWVAPAGWTALFTPVAFSNTFHAVYYRRLTGGAQDTPSASWTNSGRNSVIMAVWPGVDATTPFDVAVQTLYPASATQTLTLPSLTSVTTGARIVSGAVVDTSSASALTEPDEMVLLRSTPSSSGGREQSLADEIDNTVGASGTRSWTQTASGYRIGGFIVALRPAPEPPVLKTRTDTFAFTDKAVRTGFQFPTAADTTDTDLFEQSSILITSSPTPADTFGGPFTESTSLFVITIKTASDTFAFNDTLANGRKIAVTHNLKDTFNVSDTRQLSFAPETRRLTFVDAPVFVGPIRIIAQNIRTKEFLHWDLPLQNVQVTYTLSGPQVISGTYANENTELLDLGIEPWGTWIHVEDNGVIIASGILQPYSTIGYDQELNVEAHGVSAYPLGMPFLGEANYVFTDPATIVANIWTHLQSRPDANLGVQVIGSTSAKIGKPFPPEPPEGQEDPNPEDDNDAPFQLAWWEAPDCGEVINTLVKEGGFDFMEQQKWNAGKTEVEHYIKIADTIGSKRESVTFVEGENIMIPVQTEEAPSLYASEVWVFGAGEGRTIVKGYYGTPNTKGRVRRVYIVQDGTIKTDAQANSVAKYEYMRRQALLDVSEVVVNARHPNAPIGSFMVGDDIQLDTTIPWVGSVRQWERVVSLTFNVDEDTMLLEIRRSETFLNG